jgi:hypothetical protein
MRSQLTRNDRRSTKRIAALAEMTKKKAKASTSRPRCGYCSGAHHAIACDKASLIGQIIAAAQRIENAHCERCGGAVEFIGPYCVACAIDRAIERATLPGKILTK